MDSVIHRLKNWVEYKAVVVETLSCFLRLQFVVEVEQNNIFPFIYLLDIA